MRIADLYRLDADSATADEGAGGFYFFNFLSCENFFYVHFHLSSENKPDIALDL